MKQARSLSALTLLFLFCAAALLSPGHPAAAATNASSVWGANYFPDVPLISQNGKKLRFFTDLIEGKVVLINFIYTSCPDECGLETARLREVQKLLGDRVGRDVFIYSITIDPANDTTKVLKEYSDKFQIGPGWLFLTGKEEDITQLRKKLGLYSDAEQGQKLDHNLSLIMGNQSTGQWMKISPYENPFVIANQLGTWLHNFKMPPQAAETYANAPQLRHLSNGEQVFRTRCSACHTIGAQQIAAPEKSALGPDLKGVTRNRTQDWLIRWLADTEKMLAEKDPLAMALLAQYNNLPMPNLRLSKSDIEEVLAYIEAETTRLEQQHHHHEHQHGEHAHGNTPVHSDMNMDDMNMDDVKDGAHNHDMEMHEHDHGGGK